jgi:hypothetical protein
MSIRLDFVVTQGGTKRNIDRAGRRGASIKGYCRQSCDE